MRFLTWSEQNAELNQNQIRKAIKSAAKELRFITEKPQRKFRKKGTALLNLESVSIIRNPPHEQTLTVDLVGVRGC